MLKKAASTKYFEVLRKNVKYQLPYNLETRYTHSRLLEQGSQTLWYFANVNISAYKYDLHTENKIKAELYTYIRFTYVNIYTYTYIHI